MQLVTGALSRTAGFDSVLPTTLQVRRRAPAPVMAAIALHLELISDLVSGAIPRHLPDDFEGAAAVAAAMAALGI